MNQKTPLRNEVELSPKRFLAESLTKGGSGQDLRPKFQPIYHVTLTEGEALALANALLSVVASLWGFRPSSSDEKPD
jgi:hypothetical protein